MICALDGKFSELSNLSAGWDVYNGIPATAPCARFAKIILKEIYHPPLNAPDELVPGSDGTLQIEWHQNQFDIEIDVLDDNYAIATR